MSPERRPERRLEASTAEPIAFAPMQAVTIDDGRSRELRELYEAEPLALVFLRHLGCIFCREVVRDLSAHPEANVAFVAMERAEVCREARERFASPHPFVSDPNRSLYDAFGLGRARWTQIVNSHTVRRGIANVRAGLRNGRPTADPFMLGGAFVVDTDGRIVWSHRAKDAADNPTPHTVLCALSAAGEAAPLSAPEALARSEKG